MGKKPMGLYLSEDLQLRSLTSNKLAMAGLLAAYIASLIIYSMLVWGRKDDDYWSSNIESLGGEVNLSICEARRRNEFTQLPANALSTMVTIDVAIFVLLMFMLDVKYQREVASIAANQPASILLRFPVWSLYLGLNLLFLGGSGFFFFASTSSIGSTLFTVAQWSNILVLCLMSVNRLIDPPVKKGKGWRPCFGLVLLCVSLLAHVVLTALLVITLDAKAQDSIVDEDENSNAIATNLPTAVLYGLVVLGIFCAVIHWRAHALEIDTASVLLFLAAIVAVVAAGCFSYDNIDGVICNNNSFFQIGAIGFVLLNISALITYLFFRSDKWRPTDKPKNRNSRESRSLRLPSLEEALNNSNGQVVPEPLNRNSLTNVGQQQPKAKRGGNSVLNNIDHILVMSGNRIRRATTEIASSRLVTPQLGFTSTQIRTAEIVIGLVIIGFIVLVIYYSFSAGF